MAEHDGNEDEHMNQITERIDRAAATGVDDPFSEPWSRVIGVPAGQGLLSFRIGNPTRTPNPSPRRELSDVVNAA